MSFWKTVDEELKFRNKSRKELATEADFDVSYISKGIIRGGVPVADLALRISHVLNMPLETLLGMGTSDSDSQNKLNNKIRLAEKYAHLLENVEKMSNEKRERFIAMSDDLTE